MSIVRVQECFQETAVEDPLRCMQYDAAVIEEAPKVYQDQLQGQMPLEIWSAVPATAQCVHTQHAQLYAASQAPTDSMQNACHPTL